MSQLRAAIVESTLRAHGRPLEMSDTQQLYELETGAKPFVAAYESWREPFQELLGIVQSHEPDQPSVYMDTTTIWTAFQLVAGDSSILNAQTLMDLDKVTRAIVLNEHIYHLPNTALRPYSLNTTFGEEVFVPLDPVNTQPTVDRILWEIWYSSVPRIVNATRPPPAGRQAGPSLRGFFAADARHIFADLTAFSQMELHERYWNIREDGSSAVYSSDPVELVRNLTHGEMFDGFLGYTVDHLNDSLKAEDWRANVVIEQTRELVHRTTFHQLLSEALGVVYDPSFVRMPSIAHLTSNSTDIALAFADIMTMQGLIDEARPADGTETDARVGMRIPAFTAYALARSRSLSEWWHIVADLRHQARRYRRTRRKFQEALFLGDLKAIAMFKNELSGLNVSNTADKVDAVLGTSMSASMEYLIPGAASVFAKPAADALEVLLSRPTKAGVNALRRRLNPRVRLIHNVASAANGFLRLENKIRLLWKLDELPDNLRRLEAYAQRFPGPPGNN